MQLMAFSLLFAFGAAYGVHLAGRRSCSVSFFAARVSLLMTLLLAWFWQGPTLALQTGHPLSAMLVFVPGASGLAGLLGLEIVRFQPAAPTAKSAGATAHGEPSPTPASRTP